MPERTEVPDRAPVSGAIPTYRKALVAVCLTLGVLLTAFGLYMTHQIGGPGPVTMTCGGINFLVMSLLVRFQRAKP
jgi:hypothetical protein